MRKIIIRVALMSACAAIVACASSQPVHDMPPSGDAAAAAPARDRDGDRVEDEEDERAYGDAPSEQPSPEPPMVTTESIVDERGFFDKIGDLFKGDGKKTEEKPPSEPPKPPVRVGNTTLGDPNQESFNEREKQQEDVPDFDNLRVIGGEKSVESMFQHYGTNPTIDTAEENTSTFSVDVDTASYAISRAMIRESRLPDLAAVRVEEFVNSLRYDYPPPKAEPFSVVAEVFPSPYRRGYHLLLLGLKGRVIEPGKRPPANLVFVVDNSGSMQAGGRLEMVKDALGVLVDQLREDDTVAVVGYSDMARVVLPAASGDEKRRIKDSLRAMQPEGSTNVQAGLMLGYEIADKAKRPNAITKIILLSDGVANAGFTEAHEIFSTVRAQAQQGASLSTIGVGMGNYNDVLLEKLAVKGQGNYAYVDTLDEAKKEFVDKLGGTLVTIAKDVKIQVELDKLGVERYRLIGFENRALKNREFHDDKVDAGEIGAGHEVTALYEIKMKPGADRIGWVRLRAKEPQGGASKLVEEELTTRLVRKNVGDTSATSRLALVAAGFAEKLRGSYWARTLSYDQILALYDGLPANLRNRDDVKELGQLIRSAKSLDSRSDRFESEQPVATMDWDHLPVMRKR